MKNFIFIPGEVRSKKNSRRWIGKNMLIASKACMQYYKDSQPFWEKERDDFLDMIKDVEPPYKVEFTFVRQTKRKFDYLNLAQTVSDEMVKHRWILDDDFKNLIPYFGEVEFDKNNPGVIIKLIK